MDETAHNQIRTGAQHVRRAQKRKIAKRVITTLLYEVYAGLQINDFLDDIEAVIADIYNREMTAIEVTEVVPSDESNECS